MFRTGQVSDVTCRSPRSLSIRPLGSRLETREGTETRRKVPASSDGGGRVGGKMNREPPSLQNFNAPDGVEVKKVSSIHPNNGREGPTSEPSRRSLGRGASDFLIFAAWVSRSNH